MGYGQVVVVYDITGKPIASYTLVELYEDEADIQSLPSSVSSIWWRCGDPRFYGSKFIIHEANGGQFEFQVETGEFTYQPGEQDC